MRASFVFSEVVTGLRRNITMTIAMMLTTAVSLAMLGGGLLAVRTIDKMKSNFLADVEVSVYLTDDISAGDKTCTQSLCSRISHPPPSASPDGAATTGNGAYFSAI
jgi:cell division transport system permease protein